MTFKKRMIIHRGEKTGAEEVIKRKITKRKMKTNYPMDNLDGKEAVFQFGHSP